MFNDYSLDQETLFWYAYNRAEEEVSSDIPLILALEEQVDHPRVGDYRLTEHIAYAMDSWA